jgi:8-oxo-dGTP pyrophosphatase MutT (NUDIX family)
VSEPFRIAGVSTVLSSHVFHVEQRLVSDGTVSFERDVVVHAGAVAVLPIREDGAVGMLRQYRATFDDINWELPAGTRDVDNEAPERTAARELEEEMGVRAGHIRELFRYMNSRGWTDQTTIVYEATELQFVERSLQGPEENRSEVHWLSVRQLRELLDGGELMESSTLMALLWYLPRVGA